MGNDTIIRQFMPSVLQLNEGFPGIWTVVEGVVEVYVGRRGKDVLGTRVGKVQGRNHALKVGVPKNIFVRGRAKSGRGRRSKLVLQNFCSSYPIIIIIVVTN
jgi:hypothetical protein